MKTIAQVVAGLALLGTLLPACLLFAGQLGLEPMKAWMLGATVVWFIAAPVWMMDKSTK